jgi:hypothetical protein
MHILRLYIKGHRTLRSPFSDFINRALDGFRGLKVIACGATPIKDFCDGLRLQPDDFHVLLMDADVLKYLPYSKSVRDRKDWKPPRNHRIEDDQLHFMVIMMETWFLADPNALRQFYGPNLHADLITRLVDLESLSAEDVKHALKEATRSLKHGKGVYDDDTKLDHSIEILKILDPNKIASRAPHCRRLLETLKQKLNALE